jgi:hypothetical protein
MTSHVYNPASVICTLDGIPVRGFVDGDGISVETNAEEMTHRVGLDGEITLSVNPDKTAKIMLNVAQGSSASELLSNFRRKQTTNNLAGFSFDVVEVDSGSSASSTKAWIKKAPPVAYGMTGGDEAWELLSENMTIIRKALPTV